MKGLRDMWRVACLAALLMPAGAAAGGEFRQFLPILTPELVGKRSFSAAPPWRPVARDKVEAAVRQVIEAWNDNRLEQVLDDGFFDRSRLVDAMQFKAPRDARLEALSVGEVQTLSRERVQTNEGSEVRSTVVVTVRTQLTFNDPLQGYQRREGTNTYIMTIIEPENHDGE